MKINCLLCGVGGQGTVLASKLLAFAAMNKGLNVRTAETIGMAQRGGCVVSHVRASEKVNSPMIPLGEADVIIAFEPAEAVRCLPYLKNGGTVVVNRKPVRPVTSSLKGSSYNGSEMIEYLKSKVTTVDLDAEDICRKCGSAKVLNVALLAAAVKSGCIGITVDELKNAIKERLPEKFHELNLAAIDLV